MACGTRSIPAWAGEPIVTVIGWVKAKVYPRVGGGTHFPKTLHCNNIGLSPRGRGNRQHSQACKCHQRSIPAWAGEPKRE